MKSFSFLQNRLYNEYSLFLYYMRSQKHVFYTRAQSMFKNYNFEKMLAKL